MGKFLFSIPDSLAVRPVNRALLSALKEHKDWFYQDFVIETAYGCPSTCIWNGNRVEFVLHKADGGQILLYQPPGDEWIREVLGLYYGNNIKYRLTFTNFLLEPYQLFDSYSNYVAGELNKIGGFVMVSTDLMSEYLGKKFPDLQICWSTTTDFGVGMEKINELSAKTIVVLPYEYNNAPELDELQHCENIEVLVNEKCIDRCPRRREHWSLINKANMMQADYKMECFFLQQRDDPGTKKHHLIPREKLREYGAKGIVHFKIEGRGNAFSAFKAYDDYFVIPEFKDVFNDYARNDRWKNLDLCETGLT